MRNVLFITRYPLLEKDHLKTKFDGQINALVRLGFDVCYFAYDDDWYYLIRGDERVKLYSIKNTKSYFFRHVQSYITLYKCVCKSLKDNLVGDVVFSYLRSMPSELYHRRMMRVLRQYGSKNVVEIPTYIRNVNEKNRLHIWLIKTILGKLSTSENVDLYTLIGDETNGWYRKKRAINIVNGIDVLSLPQRVPQNHGVINILALATMTYWQGYDRAIKGIAESSQRDKVHLYMVGADYDGSLQEWKELVEELGVSKYVSFFGAKYGKDLDEIINECDVGLASLGTYRKKLKSASVLKIRDYMSRGLPFVYAAEDPAITNAISKYVMKINNDDTPIPLKEIISFAESIKNDKNVVNEMREYALGNMTWEIQFKKVLKELNISINN